ncbi:bifunctional UDP-sugar hydrolase/5'-nucleotidase [Vitiosangium sp. GDMCC 1.1324]|uniref:bifunctional metallophosphatase/5'-nucleotidase n=1 Tax=Vitiosangium sp. (strain GDMCC 1.1324) TaxID=2138576 RepID=UPI000D38A7CA|nr:bifunctional metallophosphatase/5'-nucleotidase [Vitiosangium sp. GDMCC 1.1324]PTL83454.1 bifunctional metallophosphatase/5'-nucleotidase [Vitiosangium sp. GDMCC 1.1324]
MLHSKKRPVSLAGALLALAFVPGCELEEPNPPPPPPPPTTAFTLQILHGSDMESGLPATADAPRFSAVLRALEEQYPTQTLKLASGDLWLPGVFFNAGGDPAMKNVPGVGKESSGRADMAMFNEMGFHAASFGNHEFDSGPREIRNIIVKDGDWSGAKFPYLTSNLDFSDNADLKSQVVSAGTVINASNPGTDMHNKISASVVFDVNGQKIGVVGATTPQLPRISSPGSVVTSPSDSVDYDGLAAIIQASVDKLRETGVNKIILMAHMQQYVIEVDELPKRLEGVDVIIAGGNHAVWADADDALYSGDTRAEEYPKWRKSKSSQPMAVVNVASNWRYVGRFLANFDEAGVLIPEIHDVSKNGAYATDDAGVARLQAASKVDPEVKAIADGVKGVVIAKDGAIFGKTQVYLNGLRTSVRTEETNLGNITSDANLWLAQKTDPSTSIAVKNGGGIRDSIGAVSTGSNPTYGPPAANPAANKKEGEISQLDIENSLRFNNDLSLVTVTASQLKEVLEHGVAAVAPGATPGQFPHVAGLRFEYDASKPAQVLDTSFKVTTPGQRIRKAAIVNEAGDVVDTLVDNGALVGEPTRTFRLVTLSFMASGGDNYPFPRFKAENEELFHLVSLDTTSGNQGFSDEGREQKAFADYLAAKFPASGAGYAVPDTAKGSDARVKLVSP